MPLSDLPVIVSLEVHTSLDQQQTMVEIMQEVWSGMLLDDPPSDEVPSRLPSPGELRNKILVKVKTSRQSMPSKPDDGPPVPPKEQAKPSTSSSSSDEAPERSRQKPKKTKISEALSRLAVYTKSYHFSSFSQRGKVIRDWRHALEAFSLKCCGQRHQSRRIYSLCPRRL